MSHPPIRSGDAFIDALFDLCVKLLLWLADLFGASYNTINIWIFCIIWPVFTVLLIAIVVWQWGKIRKLRRGTGEQWRLVTEYGLQSYRCGLQAGDQLRLMRTIEVECDGEPTGEVHSPGEVWTVLSGVEDEPDVIWLRRSDGEPQTWDETIFDWFERCDAEPEEKFQASLEGDA